MTVRWVLALLAAAACGACGSEGGAKDPAPARAPEPPPTPTTADLEAARTLRAAQTKEAGEWLSVFAAAAAKRDEAWRRAHPGDSRPRTEEEWEAEVSRILPQLTRHPALPHLAAAEAALRRGDEAAARTEWGQARARLEQATARLETVRRLAAEHGLAR